MTSFTIAPRSGVKTALLWTLTVAAAGMFLFSGSLKLAGIPMMVQLFSVIGVGQWFRYVTHVSKDAQVPVVGATVMSEELFQSLPPDHQTALLETALKAHAALLTQVQKEDASAYKTLLGRGMTEVDSSAGKAEWDAVYAELIKRLTGKVFSKELLASVREAAK